MVNGAAGMILTLDGEPITVTGFTVAAGRIVEIDSITDSERVRGPTAGVRGPRLSPKLLAGHPREER